MVKISVQNVSKVFGPHPELALALYREGLSREEIRQQHRCNIALHDVSLEIHSSEIIVIMGLSGSGKSTLARCLNRLIQPTEGKIIIDGEDITTLSPPALRALRQRCFGMVFQSFALFPHRSVIENVGFGLELMGTPEAERVRKSQEVLERVGLKDWGNSYPGQLSGGMKQRVGLARALALDPQVLLMDEAFSALDPLIRQEMQDELLNLQEDLQKTIIFITHDLNEAFKLGNRIVLLQDGVVVQTGTPEEILMSPANDYVARFVSSADITQVLTAEKIMKRSEAVVVLGLDGPRAALRKMRMHSITSLFVLDSQRRFAGIVHADAAEKLAKQGKSDLNDVIQRDIVTALPDVPIAQLISLMSDLPYPLAVVDENRRFKGVIVRGLLLGAIVEREGRNHAA